MEENNPHPSQLTGHSAARENLQSSTGANPPTAQGARSVSAHMNHVSVSPTDGNGPTQGQRKTLTRVGIEPTTEL